LQSFWASNAVKEEETEELAGGSSEDGSLLDDIAHWAEVLDRWVRRVDLGMGARVAGKEAPDDGGLDPAQDVEG
jgi:hypothetical protein